MKFNKDIFLTKFNSTAQQAAGLLFLLKKIEIDEGFSSDLRQIAYFLATVEHETAGTFQPIKERRERPDSPRRANQDRYWLTGYYGRGYVQITWKKNYAKFGLVAYPETALNPDVSYDIASRGMRDGLFTGKKLSDYFSPTSEDFKGARAIINGKDKAAEIAAKAVKMQARLALALIRPELPPDPTPEPASLETASLSLTGKAKGLIEEARGKYANASEGEKSAIARLGQVAWSGVAGLIAYAQTNPVKIAVSIAVLALGFWALHRYAARQDYKTMAKLGNKE